MFYDKLDRLSIFKIHLHPMKNKVEELVIIITDVKKSLALKVKSMANNSASMKTVINVKKKIDALEMDANEIEKHYSNKPEVFLNFRRRAGEITEEIEALE